MEAIERTPKVRLRGTPVLRREVLPELAEGQRHDLRRRSAGLLGGLAEGLVERSVEPTSLSDQLRARRSDLSVGGGTAGAVE